MTKRKTNRLHPRYLPSWLALGLLRVLSILPLRLVYVLGTGLGNLLHLLIPGRRKIAYRNLELCFPNLSREEIAALTKEHFRETTRAALLTGFIWWASEARLRKHVTIRHPERLKSILDKGQGVILLAPHFVALELGGVFLSLDYEGVSVYQYNRNPVFDKAMLRARQRFGAILVERKNDFRQLIRAIRSGKICYYLPDQDPGPKHAVFAPFFKIPTATWPVLGKLARVSRAAVLPCATYLRKGGACFEIVLGEPLDAFPSGDDVKDTRAMNAAIERCVNELPAQYFWVHKRFKTRPPGSPTLYL